ncbi:TPA: hypothetical protein ACID9U_002988 [Pseudomonas aeruginosa]|uniref:Uncharacterized protein n=2 Tax=root TaxID=1 RepID=A0A1C6ZDI8_9CAUD|nr:hypothetical protein [Pseudomonas aeruginosa]YP_010299319.1 hypothetical protein MPJ03_gp08 [Pseudomonas phage vB_PaeS_PcyII-40_PfII40a]AMA35484.1 hypothetical protein DPADHS01_05460 [Pseudomonas aeruginosa DHS01]AWE86173.1 hypothetical protein CSC29_0127 [Pseudomonas aeruginosa]AWR46496.1 hypothetical protein CLH63_28350 [Pseudomonas aeruginosa]AWZ89542.1 hypothetical protein CSC41_2781 [Pseudomonas aeruginosa]EIU5017600.1 hypothetical protein [Pseudomonas aeruginosa]
MTVDTYVLSDQVVLKNGNIMTQPEVVAELNSQARAALARVAELRNALNNIVHASEYTTSATHQAEVERIAFAALNGAQPAAQAQHSVPGNAAALFRAAELLAAAPGTEVPQAWLDVQAERRRQITAEGWTPDHDDLYCAAELPRAAAAYILSGANDEAPAIWPFVAKWWKPRDARANYVRAAALILAEIERLDRAASLLSQEVPPCAEH